MAKKTLQDYGNESISSLKGADRVRKRPGVIFGSDGLDGCQHAMFEILSNSIDEAREGYGNKIIITHWLDHSIEVEDFGRGIPVDFNPKENRYNWELVFCELYAGGKYSAGEEGNYEYSLGLNGLGLCATQYASEYMDVEIYRDKMKYTLHFAHGENIGGLQKEETRRRATGTKIRWKPDMQVFTDIAIPLSYYQDILKRQAVVNDGLIFLLRSETESGFTETEFCYQNGIVDYCTEIAGEETITPVQFWKAERKGRDREDKPEYKVKLSVAFCFSNRVHCCEYYHNSSWLEHGGSPERAVKLALTYMIDNFIKNAGKYQKGESKVTFADIEDCLVLVSSNFSTQTSYENQTKKAINNKFIYEAMNDFLRHQFEIYFLENPDEAARIAEQVLVNKRSRENAEKTRLNLKKKLAGTIDMSNRVQKFVDCRTKDVSRREIYIVEGDSALGSCKMGRDSESQSIIPVRGKILNCLKADYDKIFKSEIIVDIRPLAKIKKRDRIRCMKYEKIAEYSNTKFRRITGVKRATFSKMVEILQKAYAEKHRRRGRTPKLSIEDMLLATLEYLREYRTYTHIAASYGIAESNIYRGIKWVEDTLIRDGTFSLPARKAPLKSDVEYEVILVDATQTPIERPKKSKSDTIPGRKSGTR
jgi:DNA gyrase subunit B